MSETLNEEIARLRGWRPVTYHSCVAWEPQPRSPDYGLGSSDVASPRWFGFWDDRPPFDSEWGWPGCFSLRWPVPASARLVRDASVSAQDGQPGIPAKEEPT